MSNTQFISYLRDLRGNYLRSRHSRAAEAVRVTNRYVAQATQGETDAQKVSEVRAWAEAVARREYGAFDASLSFDSDG